MPAVILSPHLDDAVLSCWHVLEGPGAVRVLNVFGGVPEGPPGWWDRLTGAEDSTRRMAERHEEDRRALAAAGREGLCLAFLDAQYRRNGGPSVATLADALRADVSGAELVLAPLAGSGHPDHRLVREAAFEVRSEVGELRLYADLPHSLDGSEGPPDAKVEVHPLGAAALARKLAAVRFYRTQWPALDSVAPPGWLAEERVWRL